MTKTSIHAFRVWDKTYGYYVMKETSFAIDTNGDLIDLTHGSTFEPAEKSLIIERFTGFTDKNGKDIYEGDLITHSHSHLKHSVTFSKKLGVIYAQYSEDERAQKMLCVLNDLEVVGTVHD